MSVPGSGSLAVVRNARRLLAEEGRVQEVLAVGLFAFLTITSSLAAQTPDLPGSHSQPSPRQVQNDAQASDGTGQTPQGFSIPVRIIDDPLEAERVKQREERAERREADDLVAQQRSAIAAERSAAASEDQNRAAWIQVLLTFMGTVSLLITLLLTRQSVWQSRLATAEANRSARAAEEAIAVTREIGERQLRAYVGVIGISILYTDTEWMPNVRINYKNSGQTPAYRLTNRARCYFSWDKKIPDPNHHLDEPEERGMDLHPGDDRVTTKQIFRKQWDNNKDDLVSGKKILYVFGKISYVDAFNKSHYTNYMFRMLVDDAGINDGDMFVLCDTGNDSD